MIPLLKGPDSPGNPYLADFLAVDHWAMEKLQSGDISYQIHSMNEPGFVSLTVFVDNAGYMLPQLSSRRLLHRQLAGEQLPRLEDYVHVQVQGILPPAVSRELELRRGMLDSQFHQPVPRWLGLDPAGDAMLLPSGYVVLRQSRTREMLDALLDSQGELLDGDLARAVQAYEYRLYDSAGNLQGRNDSLPALFFELAGLDTPPGDGSMTEYGYFVFLEGDSALAQVYDFELCPLADGLMDTARDSHPFIFIKPEELRMMYACQAAAGPPPQS